MKLKTLLPVVLVLAAVATPRGEIIEQILVKVNGEIFTKSDLEQRQVAALRQKGQAIDLKSDPNNVQLRKALDEITPQIMVDAIDEMVIVQRGKELGYTLSDEQFKSVLDNINKENKMESDEQFQAALKAENMTMADLRRNLERQMIYQRVQQNEVLAKIGVTDDEARKYYESHLKEFTTPPTVTLREILVSVPGDAKGLNVAADEAAKAKAEEIRRRVTAGGENFEKLAAEMSDSPSKANAGLIGPLSVNDISPDLRKLVEAMKARRRRRARAHRARLSDPEARNDDADPDDAARAGARADQRARVHRQAQSRIPEVHPEAAHAGDHRVEEPGCAEGIRRGHEAAGGAVLAVMERGDAQWFAIWTRSRHEQVVRQQLEQKRVDAFLPTITRWSRWKDRKKKVDFPLFPGYCFARFDPADALPILKCAGVVNIVSFDGKPAPIPEYEVESIRLLVGSELQYDPCPMIHEGMMVEVVHGPLRGVLGRLIRKDAPKARLVLSVDLIGQAVSVEVDAADVKPY